MPIDQSLFDYDVTPTAVPVSDADGGASLVTLQLLVRNGRDTDIACKSLRIVVPIGPEGGDLTEDPNFEVSEARLTPWSVRAEGGGTFIAVPRWPVIGLRPGEVIGFVLRQVTVNQSEGRATITIDEDTDARRTGQVHVTKQTPGLAITQFSAVPVEILPHGKSVLTWTTTGASSCRLVPHDRPSVPVDGNTEVSPPDSTTYTLVAEGDGTSIQQQVTVSVVSVRIINFDASPREVPLGGTTTFSWQVRGAESCVIEPFRKAVDPESGTYEHVIDSSGRYSLEACGYGRLRDASVQIHVMSAEITAFGAVPSPHIIEPGGESILHWATRWASGCRIEPDLGEVPLTGTRSVAPDETTTYTFTALGQDQKKRSLTVTVGAAIAWISCTAVAENPRQVMIAWEVAGGDTTLDVWNQTSPDPRPVDKVGSKQVTVGDEGVTHIKLTVTGPDTRAACELLLLGPAIKAGASLTQFELRSPSGFTSPAAVATIAWQAAGARLKGKAQEVGRTWQLDGLVARRELQLGPRVPSRDLWSGNLTVVPSSRLGTPDEVNEPMDAAAPEIGLGWIVS